MKKTKVYSENADNISTSVNKINTCRYKSEMSVNLKIEEKLEIEGVRRKRGCKDENSG
jgi:hypothetical protein